MPASRHEMIQALFAEYIEMYAARDERLTARFSDNFSGYAGSSDVLVKDREQWVQITRQDFSQVGERIGIEMLDLALQDLAETVVVATAFFRIHLPMAESILSRETARLVLIFREEDGDWKIAHSGISIPFGLAREGEIYPMMNLRERNRELETLIDERTQALAEANTLLETLSNTDGLTGISNRRHFDRMLAQEWDRCQRRAGPLALILLDVDHFKHFNDHYGHVAGDHCLQTLASAMAQSGRRAGELVARYGGEEFVLLLPDTDEQGALEVARHIQHLVHALAMPHFDTEPGIVTASLGVASTQPSPQHTPQTILRQADAALYRAKHAGRDRIELPPACRE